MAGNGQEQTLVGKINIFPSENYLDIAMRQTASRWFSQSFPFDRRVEEILHWRSMLGHAAKHTRSDE
jgi:hypothetical protein